MKYLQSWQGIRFGFPDRESGLDSRDSLTRDVAELQVSGISADWFLSDHSVVTCILDQKPFKYKEQIVKYRKIKDINIANNP